MGGPGALGQWVARTCAVAGLTAATLASVAGPASAHAVLVGADPGFAAVTAQAPTQVRLDFSEPVEVSAS